MPARNNTPRCKQCNDGVSPLFRDKEDGKLYCGKCWKKYYGKPAPKSAAYEHGAPKAPADLPPEVIGTPICGADVTVDSYYVAGERPGEPRVYVDKESCGWSVMLKGNENKSKFCLIQLVTHPKGISVVYRREGTLGGEISESYADFTALGAGKSGFGEVFEALTGNSWNKVKGCTTRFVPRGLYTLTVDVKAARRAENELNRRAHEKARQDDVDARNKEIAEKTRKAIGATPPNDDGRPSHMDQFDNSESDVRTPNHRFTSNESMTSPAEPPVPPCTPAHGMAPDPHNLSMSEVPSSPAQPPVPPSTPAHGLRPPPALEPRDASPATEAARNPSMSASDTGPDSNMRGVSPSENAPEQDASAPPPRKTSTPPPAKPVAVRQTPPAAPRPGPAQPPPKPLDSAKPTPAAAQPKPAAPQQAAQPAPKPAEVPKKKATVSTEEPSGVSPAVIGGIAAVVLVGAVAFMRSRNSK